MRAIGRDGRIRTVAGAPQVPAPSPSAVPTGPVPATEAALGRPYSLAVGPDGTLYIADQLHGRIRAVRPDGIISTVAGSGKAAQDAAGGSALNVALPGMESIAVDPEGTLWITEAGTVRRLANGTVSTVVYSGPVGDHGGRPPRRAMAAAGDAAAVGVRGRDRRWDGVSAR